MYKVLVVDDEPLMLEGWKTMVDWHACGYELCGTATDGEEALACIRACDPELVITDIRMPVLDGIGLIRAMKEMGHDAKTIIVSAYSEFDYAQKALRYQVDRYVLKPLLTEEIHSLLRDMAVSLKDRRLTAASARKMQADAAADAIVGLLGNGGSTAVDMAARLLSVNERTRFRLILAESIGGSDESKSGRGPLIVLNTLTEALFIDGARAWTFEESPGLAGLLMMDNDLNEEQFEVRLEEAFVKNGWPPRELALYCSETAIGLMTVPNLYRQTLEIRSRALLGSHAGLHYYRERKVTGQWCLEEMTTYVGALLQAIETNDLQGIDRSVDELVSLFDKTGAQEGLMNTAVRHFRGELLRRYEERGADHREASDWLQPLLDGIEAVNTASWTSASLKRLSVKATEQFTVKEALVRANGNAITEATDYLKQHFRGKIRLQELAGRLHLNPTYFGQQFKRETGYSFHDYIHRLRIDEACKMLRRTDMLVSEIASALGYHDTEYFTAKFKALSGELPSSYKYKRQG